MTPVNKTNQRQIVRVLLVDDHHIVRSGIRRELERHDDMEVVGEAHDGAGAIALTRHHKPDVVVLDINLPDMKGYEVAEKLNTMAKPDAVRHWPPAILVLSAHSDPEYVYSLFGAGAKGYLLKDELPRRIVEGIRQIMGGMPALSLPIQMVLLTRRKKTIDTPLSQRELEVVKLMARGFTNTEISDNLIIAAGTVKNHITNIYRKLPGVRSRAEAVAWAWEHNLVSAEPA